MECTDLDAVFANIAAPRDGASQLRDSSGVEEKNDFRRPPLPPDSRHTAKRSCCRILRLREYGTQDAMREINRVWAGRVVYLQECKTAAYGIAAWAKDACNCRRCAFLIYRSTMSRISR